MAIELEGLEFQIEAKADEGLKHIDSLASSFEKLKKATSGLKGMNDVSEKLTKLNSALSNLHVEKLEALAKGLEAISAASTAKISATIPKRITDIGKAAAGLNDGDIAKLERLANAMQSLGAAGNVNIQVPNVQTQTTQNTAVPGAATSTVQQATSTIQQYINTAKQATENTNMLRAVLSGIGGVFQKGFSVLGVTALKKLSSVAKEAASSVGSLIKKAALLPVTLGSKLAASVKQSTASLGQFFNSLKRIAMYRAVRAMLSALTQGFKDGINNLYQYSLLMGGTFSQSMDSLASSALYLKNSLGAMAAPLINSLAPAIDFIIDKVVDLFNLINQLFARLTGNSTYTAAKKIATEYAEAADDAAGAAKDAANKIKSYTLGIDELNIIQDTTDTGSGSGSGSGSSTDYSSMFEELPINNEIGDFADNLREAFENSDWESLGRLLGDKVNSIFDSIDWAGIGTKLGKGIDGAVKTLYYFLDEVDFYKIGTHLSELLNNALAEIDFSFVGRVLAKGFYSLADILIGILSELDWGLVAKSLSDFIIGVFDEATDWFNSYDWSELGSLLWQKIKDVFTNIDFAGIAESFFTFLGTAIRSAAEFIGSFFGSIAEDIKKWWDEDIKGADWKETAGNLLSAIGKGFLNIGDWVMEYVVDPFCSALLGEDTWKDTKKAGGDIVDGLIEGITNALSRCKTTVTTWASNVKKWFTDNVTKSQFADHARELVDGFKSKVSTYYTQAQTAVKTWATKVKDWFTDNVTKSQFADHARELVDGFKSKVSTYYTQAQSTVEKWATKVKDWFTDNVTKTQFAEHAKELVDGFKSKVSNYYTQAQSSVTTFASNVKTWFTNLVSGDTFRQIATDVINGFKNGITQKVETVKSAVKDLANGVVEKGKEVLGVHSPSTVFYDIAEYVVLGFTNGIVENKGNASAAIEGMMTDAAKAAQDGSEKILEEWDGTWSSLVEVTQTQGEKTKQLITDGFEDCASSLTEFSGAISGIGGSISSLGEKLNAPWLTSVGNFVQGCGDGITAVMDFADNIQTAYNSIQEFAKKFDTLKTVVGEVLNTTEGDATTWGGSFMQKLSSGLRDGQSTLSAALATVKDWISGAFSNSNWLQTIFNLGQNVIQWFANGMSSAGDFITSALKGIANLVTGSGDGLSGIIDTAKGLVNSGGSSILSNLGELGSKLLSGASNVGSNLLSTLGNLGTGVGNAVSGIWSQLSTLATGAGSTLSSLGSGVLSVLGSVGTTIGGGLSTLASGVGAALGGIGSTVGAGLSSILGGISGVASTIGTGIGTAAAGVGSTLAGIGGTIASFASSIVTGPVGIAAGIAALATTVTGLIGKASGGNGLVGCLTQGVQTIGNVLGNVLSSAWSGVKSAASTVGSVVKTVATGVWNVVSAPFKWIGSLFSAGGGIFPAHSSPTLFANGGNANHGSVFVAGEAGAELVGHVNGRSEVLNKFQLGQIMHSSIVDGMAQFAGYWDSINKQLANCSNAIISAMLVSADTLYAGVTTDEGYNTADISEWTNNLSDKVQDSVIDESAEYSALRKVLTDFFGEDFSYKVRDMATDMRRQADKNETTTVKIGNKTIKEVVTTQEKADGYSFRK